MSTAHDLTDIPASPPKPPGFFRRLARETTEAGAVILDMIFHPVTHFLAIVGVILGGIVLPLTRIHEKVPGCSFLMATGMPCPGCGLTRSVIATYRLDFLQAIRLNPGGPLFAVAFLVIGIVVFLPGGARTKVRRWLDKREGYVALVFLAFFLFLFAHGLARLGLIWIDSPLYSWWIEAFPEGRFPSAGIENANSP